MKKVLFLIIFVLLNKAYSFPRIETKIIFKEEKIGKSLVTLKTEISDSNFYDIDCLSCLKKAIEISRIAFSKFCKEKFSAQSDCGDDVKKEDKLTIVFISYKTMNKIKKYYFIPISSKRITLGLYEYNRKTISIAIFSDNFYYFDYLIPLLHELAHYYFDIYDLTQRTKVEHSYIDLYLDYVFKNYYKDLFLNSLKE